MARTSSLNCLSCRNPYQTTHSLNASPRLAAKPDFSLKSALSHPLPKHRLLMNSYLIPLGHLDYICNSRTYLKRKCKCNFVEMNSKTNSECKSSLKSVSVIQQFPITPKKLTPKTTQSVSANVFETEVNSNII